MNTEHHKLNDTSWKKVASGTGSKMIRRASSAEALLHIGKSAPSVDTLAFIAAGAAEEFTLPSGISIWARARSGTADIVVIG